jgi:hypothetical protein
MSRTTIDLTARIGCEIRADRVAVLSSRHYAFESGRRMHRTTLVSEEALV